jgi:hypothetical protein
VHRSQLTNQRHYGLRVISCSPGQHPTKSQNVATLQCRCCLGANGSQAAHVQHTVLATVVSYICINRQIRITIIIMRPPLRSSGQSSWLQIRKPGFDSRFLKGKKKKKETVVGLDRGPLSLVSTTEELLDRKVAAPV